MKKLLPTKKLVDLRHQAKLQSIAEDEGMGLLNLDNVSDPIQREPVGHLQKLDRLVTRRKTATKKTSKSKAKKSSGKKTKSSK